MSLFRFIFSRSFIKHLSLALLLAGILLGLSYFGIQNYTEHDKTQEVPELRGMDLKDAVRLASDQGLRVQAEDSSYVEGSIPGSVLTQNPEPEYMAIDSSGAVKRMVKNNRKIYVTIASYLPPKVEVPNLVGKSKRIALDILKVAGIKVEAMEYVPDRVCTDCVLKQQYNGKEIKVGTKIYRGESITLVLGKKDANYVSIPKIEGYTYLEAQNILNRQSLNMGTILSGCEDCKNELDTANAFVLTQRPDIGGSIDVGGSINVILTTDRSQLK